MQIFQRALDDPDRVFPIYHGDLDNVAGHPYAADVAEHLELFRRFLVDNGAARLADREGLFRAIVDPPEPFPRPTPGMRLAVDRELVLNVPRFGAEADYHPRLPMSATAHEATHLLQHAVDPTAFRGTATRESVADVVGLAAARAAGHTPSKGAGAWRVADGFHPTQYGGRSFERDLREPLIRYPAPTYTHGSHAESGPLSLAAVRASDELGHEIVSRIWLDALVHGSHRSRTAISEAHAASTIEMAPAAARDVVRGAWLSVGLTV